MFTIICDKCGAKAKVVHRNIKYGHPEGFHVEGDIVLGVNGYCGEMICKCGKCGNIVED